MKKFQKNQIVELKHNNQYYLAEFLEEDKRVHGTEAKMSFIFNVYTKNGIEQLSLPIDTDIKAIINEEPSKRTLNKMKKYLKQLQIGVFSIGGILEKLGKVNQNIHR